MTSTDLQTSRLFRLQQALKDHHAHGLVVPRVDCYQGEYVALCDERLLWLTGFDGTAGMAIILSHRACLFVDGRYTLQASRQILMDQIDIRSRSSSSIREWLRECMEPGSTLLYDPWLHTHQQFKELQNIVGDLECDLKACVTNPIDTIWDDRPAPPMSLVQTHPIELSGEGNESKRQKISHILNRVKVNALILTSPESVAWLLNIRGRDVPYTPISQAFVIVRSDASVDVFINMKKVTAEVVDHCGYNVEWYPQDSFVEILHQLGDQRVLIDPCQVPQKIVNALQISGAKIIYGDDPCSLLRAIKNTTELKGAYAAHKRDAVAVVNFLAWLLKSIETQEITELEASLYLKTERQKQPLFQDLSFVTISAVGSNAAIIHYHPTQESDTILKKNSLYLVDSGGQYLDGTTDITRTVAIGQPTEEQIDRYTRVLKGHVALSSITFPLGTAGQQLDVLARQYLWQIGLDYEHGTGHGVGSFLSVHEGPHRISKFASLNALQPGMIVSNEPGYYKPGEYGIRIENLVTVVKVPSVGEGSMLGFENLTLVPFDKNLIDINQLTNAEREWIDAYHHKIWESLSPLVDRDMTLQWLEEATAPLK
jgi:Xaa-Pro aminopeptidase